MPPRASGRNKTYESNRRGNPAGLPSYLPCFSPSTGGDFTGAAFEWCDKCGKVGGRTMNGTTETTIAGEGDAPLADRRVVLGVTGGIAAYKAAELMPSARSRPARPCAW